MKRSDSEIEDKGRQRRDTDLTEPSVRKSRRQLRREAEATDERAPWEEPVNPHEALPVGGEPIPATEEGQTVEKKRGDTLVSVLSGNILSRSEVTRAYPYMIFVACLMFLYIANIFRTQYIYREHARLTEQVKELRAKSMTIASDKMRATRQSNIMVELERRGIPLRESLTPNKVIPNPIEDGTQTNDR
jgi:hypothetical protein